MAEGTGSEGAGSSVLVEVVKRLRSQLLLGAVAFGLVFAVVAAKPLAWTVPGVFVVFGVLDTVYELRRIRHGAQVRTGAGAVVEGAITARSDTSSVVKAGRKSRTGSIEAVAGGAVIPRQAPPADAAESEAPEEERASGGPDSDGSKRTPGAAAEGPPPAEAASDAEDPAAGPQHESEHESEHGSQHSLVHDSAAALAEISRRVSRRIPRHNPAAGADGPGDEDPEPGLFVGRREELAAARALLRDPGGGTLLDVTGVHGIGKSAFLARLIAAAERRGMPVYARNLADDGIGEGFADAGGAEVSFDVLKETARVTKVLIREISTTFGNPKVLRSVVPRHEQAVTPGYPSVKIQLGPQAHVEGDILGAASVDGERGRQLARDELELLGDQFVRAWTRFTAANPVLLVLDSFELVADDHIGQWISSLALRLPNTVTAVSRIPTQRPVHGLRRRTHRVDLDNFSLEEVGDYLARYLGRYPWSDDLAALIHDHTAGHPGGVELAAVYVGRKLGEHSRDFDFAAVRRGLTALDGTVAGDWATLVDLILGEVRRPQVTAAVKSASVTSRFTVPMLMRLLDTEAEEEVAETVGVLRELRLLRPTVVRNGDVEWERLHTFIQRAVAERLRTLEPKRWDEQNVRAAAFCFDQLTELETNDGAYGAWYRFEKPEWQDYKRAWLYYTGRIQRDLPLARARFTQVFLEVFWWWGCYYPFPYNRHLLEDWDRLAGQTKPGKDRDAAYALRDLLADFLDLYPMGHVKTHGPWEEIEDKLLELKELCGVAPGGLHRQRSAGDGSEDAATRDRVRGLIDIFLAHTHRFRDPHDPEAASYYEEALDEFTAEKDVWIHAWLLRERADLALEGGHPTEALALVAKSALYAGEMNERDEEWDHELLSDLLRIAADVFWETGDRASAAPLYSDALLQSYIWQNGSGQPPDEYTAAYYGEISGRIVERLYELAGSDGPDAVAAFAAAVVPEVFAGGPDAPTAAEVPGLLEPGREPAVVAAAIFPRPPVIGEEPDEGFLRLWRRHVRRIPDAQEVLDRLLGIVGPADVGSEEAAVVGPEEPADV